MRLFQNTIIMCIALSFIAWCCFQLTTAQSTTDIAKVTYSNPVITVNINETEVNLILTSYINGILLCSNSTADTKDTNSYETKRSILQSILTNIATTSENQIVSIPMLNVSKEVLVHTISFQSIWDTENVLGYFLSETNTTGFIGVGFGSNPNTSEFWNLVDMKYTYKSMGIFDDINKNKESKLRNHEASIAIETSTGDEEWSEPMSALSPNSGQGVPYHTTSMTIQHLALQCNTPSEVLTAKTDNLSETISVFGEFSNNWIAIMDFNTPCLHLPAEFYDGVAAWSGIVYNENDEISTIPKAQVDRLPILTFSIILDGGKLQIPIQSLIINSPETTNDDGDVKICIIRSASILQSPNSILSTFDLNVNIVALNHYSPDSSIDASSKLFEMSESPVVLGVMAMQALGSITLDASNRQVAVHVRENANDTSSALNQCQIVATKCTGQQIYLPRLNKCNPPDCSQYLFHYLDETTNDRCKMDSQWASGVLLAVTILTCLEFFSSVSIRGLLIRAARL